MRYSPFVNIWTALSTRPRRIEILGGDEGSEAVVSHLPITAACATAARDALFTATADGRVTQWAIASMLSREHDADRRVGQIVQEIRARPLCLAAASTLRMVVGAVARRGLGVFALPCGTNALDTEGSENRINWITSSTSGGTNLANDTARNVVVDPLAFGRVVWLGLRHRQLIHVTDLNSERAVGTLYAANAANSMSPVFDTCNHPLEDVLGLAIHPDGSLLGVAGSAGGVGFWDLRCGKRLTTATCNAPGKTELSGPPPVLPSLRVATWSPRGIHFITGGDDGVVSLWDIRNPAFPALRLGAHSAFVSSAAFIGKDTLLTAAYGGAVRQWALPTGEPQGYLDGHRRTVRFIVPLCASVGRTEAMPLVATAGADVEWKLWALRGAEQRRIGAIFAETEGNGEQKPQPFDESSSDSETSRVSWRRQRN